MNFIIKLENSYLYAEISEIGGELTRLYNKETKTWYNKQDNANRASNAGFSTQKEAIDAARTIAINQGLEHSIHRADNNQIRDKNSYGNDDFPPRG